MKDKNTIQSSKSAPNHPSSLHLLLTVFTVNFCIMTLELVAGRMIAPYLGVSLYTWTAVIGIVLLGMSVGNYYGGKIADLYPKTSTLTALLAAAGVSALIPNILLTMFGSNVIQAGLPYLFQVLLLTSIFFFPSLILGSITPVIVKLKVRDLKTTGNEVGKIYATSSLGSIIGTYATGFVLISMIGVRTIIILIAVILVLLALSQKNSLSFIKKQKKNLPLTLLVIVLMLLVASISPVQGTCYKESQYYCIKVLPGDKPNTIKMVLDRLTHSITNLEDPLDLQYEYEKTLVSLFEYLDASSKRTLLLGGGGYTFPRYLIHKYNQPAIVVSEIDPIVSKIAFDQFDMPIESSVVTANLDARIYLQELADTEKFAYIIGDVYSDLSVPYHLTTKEFAELIAKHLEQSGIYAMNVIDTLEPGLLLHSLTKTVSIVFDYVYIFSPNANVSDPKLRNTYIIAATRVPIDEQKLASVISKLNFSFDAMNLAENVAENQKQNSQDRYYLLTDDFAPTDNLTLPLYTGSISSR